MGLLVICTQHGIIDLEPKIVKDKQRRNQLLKLFDDKELQMMISLDLMFIEFLDPVIANLERQILRRRAKRI